MSELRILHANMCRCVLRVQTGCVFACEIEIKLAQSLIIIAQILSELLFLQILAKQRDMEVLYANNS